MGRACLTAAWLIGIIGVARADAPPVAKPATDARYEVDAHPNLAYRTGKDADPVRHTFDLYVPKGMKDFPTVVFVHGGTWKTGSKGLYAPLGMAFAKCGIGAAVVNYRLSPAVQHPAHVEDVAAAFAWVHAHVAEFGGRADRLFLVGHSAGGHLVSLLALDDKYLKAVGRSVTDVRGVVAVSGVYGIDPQYAVFRPIFGTDVDVCRLASPLTHVTPGPHPPFLLVYADKELPGLGQMAVDMQAAFKKAGGTSELRELKDRNHVSIIVGAAGPSDPLSVAVRTFVAKYAK